MFLIYFINLMLIIYFIYLVIKYNGAEKPEYDLIYFRDKEFIKYPPIVVGFLKNKTIKKEHFIATALDFVCKGFIKVEQCKENGDYIFTIIKKIQATEIEYKSLRIFFNTNYLKVGTKQSLKQFKKIIKNEKLFGNYGKIKRDFNKDIRESFDKAHEVLKISRKTNIKNIFICYCSFLVIYISLIINQFDIIYPNPDIIIAIFLSISIFSLFTFSLMFIKAFLLGYCSCEISIFSISILLNTSCWILVLMNFTLKSYIIMLLSLIIMAFIILFDDMMQRKKTNLANTYEMIKGLKRYIIDYSNINEYDIYNIYLWNEYYVYAVALNIKKI